eukprot:30308-Pelagococcus_subviridis.AAC.20
MDEFIIHSGEAPRTQVIAVTASMLTSRTSKTTLGRRLTWMYRSASCSPRSTRLSAIAPRLAPRASDE